MNDKLRHAAEVATSIIALFAMAAAAALLSTAVFVKTADAKGFDDRAHASALSAYQTLHSQCEDHLSEAPASTYPTPEHVGMYYSVCMSVKYEQAAKALKDRIDNPEYSL